MEAVTAAGKAVAEAAGSKGFSREDLIAHVLAEHPDLDALRLKRCVDIFWRRSDPYHFDQAEEAALWEQQKLHAETLPYPENVAYLKECAAQTKAEADRRAVGAFILELHLRVLFERQTVTRETTVEQALTVLGVEGFVAGIRDELVKDGIVHGNVVEIPGCNETQGPFRYALTDVLKAQRRWAQAMLRHASES